MKRPTDAENRQIGTKAIIDIYGQILTLKTFFFKRQSKLFVVSNTIFSSGTRTRQRVYSCCI